MEKRRKRNSKFRPISQLFGSVNYTRTFQYAESDLEDCELTISPASFFLRPPLRGPSAGERFAVFLLLDSPEASMTASPGVLGGSGSISSPSHRPFTTPPAGGLIDGELGKVSAGPVPEDGDVLRRVADHLLPLKSPVL